MKELKIDRYTMNIFSGIFFLLLLFNCLTLTKLPIRDIAFTTMEWTHYIAIFIMGYLLARRTYPWTIVKPFHIGILIFAISYISLHLLNGNAGDDNGLTQILLYLLFIVSMAYLPWEKDQYKIFGYISAGLCIIIFIHWIFSGLPMTNFKGLIRNPNITGVFVSCLLFFLIIAFKKVSLKGQLFLGVGIGFAIILIYVSSARAVLLLLVTAFGARIVLFFSKKLFSFLFYLVMLFNAIFLFTYGLLSKSSYFSTINEWSMNNFGKNFFSGRQNIWNPAILHGFEEPFFGHRINILPEDYIQGTHYVHAHNQYLQVFLESGIVGIICFSLLLLGIWKVYQRGLHSSVVRWSACFFLGILVYQSMEISLFFNMHAIGLLQWLIISIGIGGVLHQTSKERGRRSI
ncbi:O-antigen ligase family protein [Virgibacillus halodenitrificans]|uniref:O-antigen ligase family protein n=1 Tax=Virgibacillus halodenitrificans TaxID=1482 RepID=UPI001F3087EC|nr:O-antigen ligase family protein [Virgibacillus halodenitrificans]MCG1027065.1 O-antigen ligase family protein [Virgibacillus halodenitrificans]